MTYIHQAKIDKDRSLFQEFFQEYLEWANTRCNKEYGLNFDIKSMLEQDMTKLEIFLPPYGRLLLVIEGIRAAGIACMRKIRKDIGRSGGFHEIEPYTESEIPPEFQQYWVFKEKQL